MTVLLALCPLVVEATDGLSDRPSDNAGARVWVWRRLEESGRVGVTEAARVFEAAASLSGSSGAAGGGDQRTAAGALTGAGAAGGAASGGGQEQHGRGHGDDEKGGWDRLAASADCYNFARETGIITAGELFLGATTTGGGRDGGVKGQGRTSGKKRKASASASSSAAPAAGEVGASPTQPRVLRSLAGEVERFGKFLEDFSFQSLVGEGDGGEISGGGDGG